MKFGVIEYKTGPDRAEGKSAQNKKMMAIVGLKDEVKRNGDQATVAVVAEDPMQSHGGVAKGEGGF